MVFKAGPASQWKRKSRAPQKGYCRIQEGKEQTQSVHPHGPAPILSSAADIRPLSNATIAPEGAAVIIGLPAAKFYKTPEWRAIRYQAFRKYGPKCMVCGRTRDDGIAMHVAHIRHRVIFPELALDIRNLQILCEDCNVGQDVVYADDWRPRKVARP